MGDLEADVLIVGAGVRRARLARQQRYQFRARHGAGDQDEPFAAALARRCFAGDSDRMKITSIDAVPFGLQPRRDFNWAGLRIPLGGFMLVRICTDAGYGEATPLPDWAGNYYEDDVVTAPFQVQAGSILPLERPGLGIEVDERKFERFRC